MQHFDDVDLCDCGYRFSTGQVEKAAAIQKSRTKSKSILATIGVLILALIAGKYFGQMVGSEAASIRSSVATHTEAAPSVESQLAELATAINSRTPQMVDARTRLDRAIAGPGYAMTYLYTLPEYAAADIDQSMAGEAAQMIRAHACGSAPLVKLLNQGVTATYVYRGNDGKDIVRTEVHGSDCKGQQHGA